MAVEELPAPVVTQLGENLPLFGNNPYYIAIAILVLGAIGGIVFALLMEKGLAWPYKETKDKQLIINFGFVADVIIGSVAAAVTYALNPPTGVMTLIVIGITSGIGGKAILTGYIKGKEADKAYQRTILLAERYRAAIERQPDKALLPKELDAIDAELLD
jgi:hypothetical protein